MKRREFIGHLAWLTTSQSLPRIQENQAMNRRMFVQTGAALGLAFPLGRKCYGLAGGEPAAQAVGLTSQLFLDDFIVESMKGLKRQLHQPKKQGLILDAQGKPMDRGSIGTVVRDTKGRFHMFYYLIWQDAAVNKSQDKNTWLQYVGGCYASSADGVRWEKPSLGLIEGPTGFRPTPKERWKEGIFEEVVGMSKQSNLGHVVAVTDLFEFGGLRDPRRRYLVFVRVSKDAWAESEDQGLYFAADVPDQAKDPQWRKRLEAVGKKAPPRGWFKAVFDEKQRVWVIVTQVTFPKWTKPNVGRYISRRTSPDLVSWSAEEDVLPIAANDSHKPTDRVEYMDINVTRVADLWLGQLLIFHGDRSSPQFQPNGLDPKVVDVWLKGTGDLRLIVSRDAGKTWQPVAGQETWLPHHVEETGFDRYAWPGEMVRVKDELWLYYGCRNDDHLTFHRDGTPYHEDRYGLWATARATLRWDGYLSLQAGEVAGEVTTKPLVSTGRRLNVNAEASKGSVRVEVQDANGKVLPGFALADCTPLTGDGIAQAVRWQGGAAVPQLPDKPVRLRFQVQGADLYGFQLAAEKP